MDNSDNLKQISLVNKANTASISVRFNYSRCKIAYLWMVGLHCIIYVSLLSYCLFLRCISWPLLLIDIFSSDNEIRC